MKSWSDIFLYIVQRFNEKLNIMILVELGVEIFYDFIKLFKKYGEVIWKCILLGILIFYISGLRGMFFGFVI